MVLPMRLIPVVTLTLLLGSHVSDAQGDFAPPMDQRKRNAPSTVGFVGVSERFLRNFGMLLNETPEPEVREQMESVIAHVNFLLDIYKRTGRQREELLLEIQTIETLKNRTASDTRKIEKLRERIKELDPQNEFQRRARQLEASVRRLRELHRRVIVLSDRRQDILRLTEQHLDMYLQAIRLLPK